MVKLHVTSRAGRAHAFVRACALCRRGYRGAEQSVPSSTLTLTLTLTLNLTLTRHRAECAEQQR